MIGEIENAIVARIKDAQTALGYNFKKVDTYGGEFADGLERVVRDFPCILVVFNGMQLQRQARNTYRHTAHFLLICCANNLRNEKTARQGTDGEVGSYQIAEDMVRLMAGQNLALDYLGEIVPTGIRSMINDKSSGQLASVYAVDLEMVVDISVDPNTASLEDFETLNANWDVPAHGNVEPPLPADDTADATDKIELETN